jgi:GTP-binding protein
MKFESNYAAAFRPDQMPADGADIVAFAGRSNVGKSSLLNRLLSISLARVSRTPGRTHAIFFYPAGGWTAADLPGFGYAKVSAADRRQWAELVEAFYQNVRPALTIHLIDPKIPISDLDIEFRDYLRGLHLASVVVATKADRLDQAEKARAGRRFGENFEPACFVSSRSGAGLDALIRLIDERMNHGEKTKKPGQRRRPR